MSPASSCQRELEIEIPVEVIEKETQRITREFSRVARIPGFRPGKAPAELVRRRFWEDIKSELLHSLIPSALENSFREKHLVPVAQPRIADLVFEPQKPLRFKASFEVLPEIQLKDYKGLNVEKATVELTEKDVERELDNLRQSAAVYQPVEGRPAAAGDTVWASMVGLSRAEEKLEPIVLEEVRIELGGENTLGSFSEALQGAGPGEERQFDVTYPADYPTTHLAGRTIRFTARVKSIKRLELPELNDEFAQQVGDHRTLAELRTKLRQGLEAARAMRERELTTQRLLDALLERHDFPVPEALVERQLDLRLESQIRALLRRGIDPRRVDVDWAKLRRAERPAAQREVRVGLLLERIAAEEKIEASEAEIQQKLEQLAGKRQQSPEALRARLTKEAGLDSIASGVRSEKVIELLHSHARFAAPSRS